MNRVSVHIKVLFKKYQWALLSGFLVGTSYMPFPPWAVLFCWTPLWWSCLQDKNLKDVFKKAWVSQFVLTLIGFHWIAYVSHEFGFMPKPIALLVLLLFASTVHIYIPLAVVAARFLGSRFSTGNLGVLIMMAAFHVVGETYWPSLFTWNLGYTLFAADLSVYQIADVIGFLGLSFLLHLSSAIIVWLILKKNVQTTVSTVGWMIFIFAGLTFWGRFKADSWRDTDSWFSTLIVQANIGNFEKLAAEKGRGYQKEIADRYFELTRAGLATGQKVDLVVWPETAYPDYLGGHNHFRINNQYFTDFAREIKRPILTGAYGNDPPDSRTRAEYNAVFLYDGQGKPLGESYKKTKLLAFGEYTPLGDLFPILKKWNPAGSGWGRGSGPITMDLGPVKLGPQICYESLYPDFAASSTRNGAQILINVTNDSWFGPRSEPIQHMYMTLARAIENRRPMIRSTNTGISTVVLADGRILNKSPLHQPWQQVFDIPYRSQPELTFYSKFYFLFPFILALIIGIAIWKGKQQRE